MSKIVFIRKNSPEIRKRLKEAGFSICIYASFEDSVWLYYYPEEKFPYDIHGEGFADIEDPCYELPSLERIQSRLNTDWYHSKEREFFDDIEEFIKKYGKLV